MRSALGVLATLVVFLGAGLFQAPTATADAASSERLTATQAKRCTELRAKVRARTVRIKKLRQRHARPATIRKARDARRRLVQRTRQACRPPAPAPPPVRKVVDGVVIFGDSMTVNATPTIKALFPDWEMDAVWGRGVSVLPNRIAEWTTAHDFAPSVVVFALGTNEQAGWDKADYIAAADMLPPGTRLVFVNTWRPNAGIGTPQDGSLYSGWMDEIAAERPRTTVADWRGAASAQPGLTYDGLHQTTPEGVTVWTGLVADAVTRALAMP